MTDPRLAVIVLAAGQGTRMRSARAKVLHPLAGVPLIGHVLATARELSAAHVIFLRQRIQPCFGFAETTYRTFSGCSGK